MAPRKTLPKRVLLTALAGLTSFPSSFDAQAADRRNVLFLFADDMGVDKVGAYAEYYNSTPQTDDEMATVRLPCTPTLDTLAARGVMFVNAYACPVCSPTRASIITGTHPFRHGIYHPAQGDLDFDPGSVTTIAEVLGAAGYESGLFGKWHLGNEAEDYSTNDDPVDQGPVDHGWDWHVGFLGGGVDHYNNWRMVVSDKTLAEPSTDRWQPPVTNYITTVLADSAVSWIGRQTVPWMAWVCFNAPHDPWLASDDPPTPCGCIMSRSSYDPTKQDSVYQAAVECMDEKIEAMLGSIDSAVLENTTIIFMADNGTPRFRSEQFPDNRLKDSMFEGGINVPLIITDGYTYLHPTKESPDHTYPGWVASPNRIATALVQEVDLFATIADIAGADKSTAIDAATLIPLLESTGDSPVRAFVFEQAADTVWTVRGPEFKLIRSNILFTASPHSEAYDLANDRWEESAAAESVFGFSMLTVYKMVARAISASLEL